MTAPIGSKYSDAIALQEGVLDRTARQKPGALPLKTAKKARVILEATRDQIGNAKTLRNRKTALVAKLAGEDSDGDVSALRDKITSNNQQDVVDYDADLKFVNETIKKSKEVISKVTPPIFRKSILFISPTALYERLPVRAVVKLAVLAAASYGVRAYLLGSTCAPCNATYNATVN